MTGTRLKVMSRRQPRQGFLLRSPEIEITELYVFELNN